jgi:hypothetical protein
MARTKSFGSSDVPIALAVSRMRVVRSASDKWVFFLGMGSLTVLAAIPAVSAAIAGDIALIEIAGVRIEREAVRSSHDGRGRAHAAGTA